MSRLAGLIALGLGIVSPAQIHPATLPANFIEETIGGTWNEAVGLTFASDGRMFVWERGGRVWNVENGVRSATPFLDISEEVGVWNNFGLLGFCLHPDFLNNGYVYVLYVVDHHHLQYFGTPSYNPGTTETHTATIGRIARYTARASDGLHSVDPASRKVLLGESATSGFPIVSGNHGVGTILFGSDGTLLASCGDGASSAITDIGNGSGTYYQQALSEGIIQPKENVGAYRAQLVDSLNGKIIRIDPVTGDGIPGNPFYDLARPRSARSRVWALGLKTPCRITLRPGTGSHNRADANPGVIYIGDVGWNTWEDLNVCSRPGMNFGWPVFEGMEANSPYFNAKVQNLDAPNPLYGAGGCVQPYFYFTDLIKQDTLGTPSWPNPCNPSQQIPASIPRFLHARPVIDWKHGSSGPARAAIYSGTNAAFINLGAAGSPVRGATFGGNCSIGGVWYGGSDFPAIYRNTYFHAEYGEQWIKNFVFDQNDAPVEVREFASSAGGVVFVATHPIDGALYYITWTSTLRKIRYVLGGNLPPTAAASLNKSFGSSPLTVQFTGTNSTDPEKLPLSFQWNFGDGSPVSTDANPTHIFIAPAGVPTRYDVTLRVTDRSGAFADAALIVSVNNTPPTVTITSPIDGSFYSVSGDSTYPCTALVTDAEQDDSQLTWAWQTILHHNNHIHSDPVDTNRTTITILSPEGCDGQTYFYNVILTVTDAAGLSTTNEARLYPDCTNVTALSAIEPALALDPGKPPGSNFDLSHWYLTIPDSGATEIPTVQLLAGYSNSWFFTGPDGAMVFWCPVTGGTTPNSSYPRSELRELINPPDYGANWTVYGTHTLDAQCMVTRLPSTGRVIIGQIHSYTGNANPLLKFVYDNGMIDAQVKQSPNSSTDLHLSFFNVAFNSLITYRIVLADGLLTMTINGQTQSMNVIANDPQWANQTFYFKAGSYCQDNSGTSLEGAQVAFYGLTASHSNSLPVAPSITRQPTSQAALVGSNVVFSVTAAGGLPLNYQWRKDGLEILAATNSFFAIASVQQSDAGAYSVIVTNVSGMATSSVAVLTLLTNPGPISLSDALDTGKLIWTTNGSPPWEGHFSVSHDGVDAARSGAIADGKSTSLQTTVTGPGTVTFWWKVSSETNKDYLIFYVGSSEQARISGAWEWQQRTFAVPSGSQVLKWTYSKNSSAAVGQDRGWVDEVVFASLPPVITGQPVGRTVDAGAMVALNVTVSGTPPFNYQWQCNGTNIIDGGSVRGASTASLSLSNAQPAQSGGYTVIVSNDAGTAVSSNALVVVTPIVPLADALDSTTLVWTTNGSPPWIGQPSVTHDGVDAARSGAIGDSQTTSFQTTVNGPGSASFWWKVSSETNKDLLLFYVGSSEQARISGETDWQQRTFTLPPGNQVLKWTYSKNSSTAKGLDRAWVDQVTYTPVPPPATPNILSATVASMSEIDLAWNDTSTNEYGFRLERSTNGSTFGAIASLGSNVTTYVNTGLLAGVTYYYRVSASNAAGASAYSSQAVATTPAFVSARINFQPASAPVPPGYWMDGGLVYGDRGNGLIYGWNSSKTSSATDRNSPRSPDQRYDTFISSGSSSTLWEISVPNGPYNVLLVAGDPESTSGIYKFSAEGVLAVNGTPNSTNRWISGRVTVVVSDGRLTIGNVSGASNNKLCFIEIAKRGPLLTCSGDKTVECGSAWGFDVPAATIDNCGGSNVAIAVIGTITNTAGFCGNTFSATRTWSATDACGNSNTCAQTVTVVDTTPPSIVCPPDRTVECGTAWSFDAPSAGDFCGGTNVAIAVISTITNGLCGATFTAIRSWMATDACGNSNTCSQTVTVVDTTPPSIVCAPGRTVECGTAWSFDSPVASDLCGGTNVTVAILSTITNSSCGNTFAATRTWSATDGCGNSNTCSQTVTVTDTRPPSITCAPTRTVECGAVWTFDTPAASDLCDGTNIILSIISTITNGGPCGNTFTATRTWSATDACGNSNICSQIVTVVDTTPPAIACVPTRTVECGTAWEFDLPSAVDLCDGTNVTVALLSTITNSLCGNTFTATRTWSASDSCGNSNICSQSVTVLDTTPPSITCAPNRTVECTTAWCFEAPEASDRCDGTNITVSIISTITNGLCGNTFAVTRTWSATDACGNSNTCSQTVTVVDTTPPAIACVPSQTVECSTAWSFDLPSAMDLCDDTNVTIAIVSTITNGICGNTFTATRTWSATDRCGNSNTCSQAVTVVDTTPPSISCASSQIVECGTAWSFDLPGAFDRCDGTNVALVIVSTITNGLCGDTFAATRIWSATDACGNSNICSQTVTVVDTTPPAIACVPSQTVECGAAWSFDLPSAMDLCDDTNVTIAIVSTITNGFCGNTFTATRTWSATDDCGNSNTCSQTITVVDTTPPAIICTDIITCNPRINVSPRVTDNCDPDPQLLCIRSDGQPLDSPFPLGATLVTCTAMDQCLNSATCQFQVAAWDRITVAGPANQIVCAGGDAILSTTISGFAPVTYVWKFNGVVIPNAIGDSISIASASAANAGTYSVEIISPCNSVTNVATLIVAVCPAIEMCSLTQGFYGNPEGQFSGTPTLDLLNSLLTPSPVVVGKIGLRSLTIGIPDISNLVARLPADGTAGLLPDEGDQVLGTAALPLTSKDKFDNLLLGETIVLALNIQLEPNLPSFGLTGDFCTLGGDGVQTFGIQASVVAALGDPEVGINNVSVAGLLELANYALAALPTGGASLADISGAVSAINRGFDGCRTLVLCGPGATPAP